MAHIGIHGSLRKRCVTRVGIRSSAVVMVNAMLWSAVCVAQTPSSDDTLRATPYRPTVSNPADLPVPRHLEWEAGGEFLRDDEHERESSLPFLLKYAFDENFGVLLGGDALVSNRIDGDSTTGSGDTSLVLKFRHAATDSIALGLEASATFPTASAELGSGSTDYTVNGIVSTEIDAYDIDVNLSYTRLGATEAGTGRAVVGWAVAASHALGGAWTGAAEFSGAEQNGAPGTAQFLGALSYALRSTLVIDGGASCGLKHAAPRFGVFAGVTMLMR
jgi:hypothetical protein